MLGFNSRIRFMTTTLLTLVLVLFALSFVPMSAQTLRGRKSRPESLQSRSRSAPVTRDAERSDQSISTKHKAVSKPEGESERGEAERIEARILYFRQRQREMDRDERLKLVREEYERLEAEKAARVTRPTAGTTWVSIGPTNGAGRMTAVAPHPTAMGTLYAGADGGGVWKTTNGGVTWLPLTESVNNLNIGALALAPSFPNMIYAGTGTEGKPGIGFLKSTDSGATWIFAATAIADRFFRFSVHPTNPLDILAGTSSGGLRSTNGGVSWTTVIPNNSTVTDVVRDPANPQILYAAVWNCPTSCYSTVFKSTDAGATWVERRAGLPVPNNGGSYAVLAINPTNPLVLYLSFALFDVGTVSHIAKTTDGGNTWTDLPDVFANPDRQFMLNQPFHNNAIVVSPTNPNIVTAGGVFYIRSTDAGATWTRAPMDNGIDSPHVDATDLRYQAGLLYIANDGGIWSSPDDAQTSTNRNAGLVTREFYALANDEVNHSRVFAGSQDNGTDRRPESGGAEWTRVGFGDGFYGAVNPLVPPIAYTTFQLGSIFRTKDAGSTTDPFSLFINGEITPPYPTGEPVPFGTILHMNPAAPSKLYTRTDRLWATGDGGESWTPLPTTTTDGSVWYNGTGGVSALALSSSNPLFILVARRDPAGGDALFHSTNGGMTWTRSTTTTGTSISNLEIDPRNANIAYATTRNDDDEVLMTSDGGTTWLPRSSGLPLLSPQVIRVDPTDSNTLYLGTDLGVYWSTDQGTSWTRYGVGLPSVLVTDLRILEDGSVLRAATYGRGVWEIVTPTTNDKPATTIHYPTGNVSVAKGTTLTFRGTVSDPDAGDSASATWLFTDNWELISRNSGTSSVRHTFNQAGAFWVSLAARDTHGARNAATVLVKVGEPFDDCVAPLVIPSNGPFPYSIETSNEAATVQASDPTSPSCSANAHTTWFEFTPAVSGTYQFTADRLPFNYAMLLSLWTGPRCGPYIALPDNCLQAPTVAAQAGVTLRLMVGASGVGVGRAHKLTVTRLPAGCDYSISASSQNMTFRGGSASVDIATSSACAWSANPNAAWVSIVSNNSGTGNSVVHYFVDPNPGPARTGTLTIAGKTLTVKQDAAGCNYLLATVSASFASIGGVGSIALAPAGGCAWTATSNAPWIIINSGSGAGTGAVGYTVTANTSPNNRTGTMTIAGQLFTVTQTGFSLKQTAFDVESDTRSDLGFYRNGVWGVLKSSSNYSFASPRFFSWGGPGLPPITADFDGDLQTDLAYIVPPAGGQSAAYAILKSSTNYDFGQAQFAPAGFPVLGDTPVVGDFDGDGKADPGIWRASQGVWIIPLSSTNYTSFVFTQWGQPGDTPVVSDFDGDGRADIGFYRNGLWGVLKSTQAYSFGSAAFFSWGGAGLPPIVADFDGDGRADLAYVVPPGGGQSAAYAILKSGTGYDFGQALFVPAGFPSLGDTPAIGDYDGDGKADPGIWRESQGVWIIALSSGNYTSYIFTQWGQSGDIAFPKSTRPHE